MSSPRDMSGNDANAGRGGPGATHVVDDVADYLAGRCPHERAEDIREHLRACPACAADYAWAAAFRAGGQPTAAHLSPDRIAELSAGGASSAPHEQAHLVACAVCARELTQLRSVSPPPELGATVPPVTAATAAPPRPASAVRRPAARRPAWRWAPVALAIAAAFVLLLRPWQARDVAALRALAQVEALPVSIDRGELPEPGFAELRLRGLEAYEGGDYASAATLLGEAVRLNPDDPEMLLYLGSCALLRQQPNEAIQLLQQADEAAQRAAPPGGGEPAVELAVEIGWQLAQAHLAAGHRGDAERILTRLAAWQGARGAAVDALLQRVRATAR